MLSIGPRSVPTNFQLIVSSFDLPLYHLKLPAVHKMMIKVAFGSLRPTESCLVRVGPSLNVVNRSKECPFQVSAHCDKI